MPFVLAIPAIVASLVVIIATIVDWRPTDSVSEA